jgi:hypothetical protein
MLKTIRIMALCLGLWTCTATAIHYNVIAKGTAPGQRFASPRYEVIVDDTQFRQVFQTLHADQLPSPPAPAIDFEHAFVLLVAMGQRTTTGYSVEVEQVERHGDVLRVNVRFEEPSPQARHAAMVTQPFVLVQAPKVPGVRQVQVVDQAATDLASLPVPQ